MVRIQRSVMLYLLCWKIIPKAFYSFALNAMWRSFRSYFEDEYWFCTYFSQLFNSERIQKYKCVPQYSPSAPIRHASFTTNLYQNNSKTYLIGDVSEFWTLIRSNWIKFKSVPVRSVYNAYYISPECKHPSLRWNQLKDT